MENSSTISSAIGTQPAITVRRLKNKTLVFTQGFATVTIRYEKPRGNRKSWRVEWFEDGKDCDEMYATLEDAKTHAEVKLNQLSSGQRVLTKAEIDGMFAFQLKVEQFELRLKKVDRTLDDVVSDAIAAEKILPGWTAASMAQYICEKHGIENPQTLTQVKESYIDLLKSGYKRNYSKQYVAEGEYHLMGFIAALGLTLRIELTTSLQILEYLKNLRVMADSRHEILDRDATGRVPASQKTKNIIYTYINRMFLHAKKILRALPANLHTVVEMIEAPSYQVPEPEIYNPAELATLFQLMPDRECLLFVYLLAFAGLRPCEAKKLEGADFKKDANGNYDKIRIRQAVGKKDPKSGRRRVRTRSAPITAPLAALLKLVEIPTGPLFVSKDIQQRIYTAIATAKFAWKHDGLRHSFITYRLAAIKDRAQVAVEAGHGVDVQLEHYEGLLDELDVPAYWSFVPNVEGLPATLNNLVVGTKFVRAHKLAKQKAETLAKLPLAA